MDARVHLSVMKGPTRILKPNSLHKMFEVVAKGPAANNTALIYEENGKTKKYKYSELDDLTNRLANVIVQNVKDFRLTGNKDGDFIVAVNMHPSDYLVITLLSILKSGAAYLPIDPTFPAARVEHILREAKPVMMIYDEANLQFDNIHKLSFRELLLEGKTLSSSQITDDLCLKHVKDDLAIVLYTSGSTGVPKGVRLPHKTILNRLQWQFKTFPYSKTEANCVFKTALTFVDSVAEIWGPLVNGLTIVVVPKATTRDPEKLVTTLENYKIERLVLVPSLLRSLLMYLSIQERLFLNHLKLWVCSGETLVTSLAEEFFSYFNRGDHKLCNFYGSTEVMGDVTYHVMSNLDQVKQYDKIPIGLPVDNTIIYLLDNDFRPVKTGEMGELFVSGQNLASGYVNGRDPEKFIENPLAVDPTFGKLYRTGDFARIQKGTLFYEGRTDSQVKIRGHRVDLSEVEKAVNAIEEVDKGIVLCYKPGELNQALLAFVTTEANINENHIESILRDQLAPYMVPRVVILESIPLLVNGKIDRQSLLRSFENSDSINGSVNFQVDIDFTGVADNQMEAARILFETVAVVLNRSARSAISIEANFYDIGGNSLNSIFTIMSLNEKGYHISIGDFIASMDLGEVLDRMTGCSQNYARITTQPPCYFFEYLKDEHKKEVIEMITTSFFQKADLERCMVPHISERDYDELIGKIWVPLVEKELSFVTKTNSGKIVGVSLNFDARDEPEVEIHSKLTIIFEFLEFLEGPIRDSILPKGVGTILHSFMMATNSELTTKENVGVMQFMEEQVIRIANTKGFVGVFTSNTSPLTQQLGRDIYQYKTLLDYQVNQYITSDGMKPFGSAPDSQRVIVQWKEV